MASGRPRVPRTLDEPAFVLHQYAWSESSLILEVLSRQHGRVALVAKGVKRPTSQFRAVLLPLQPLRLSWSGEAEVRTLKAAHWQGGYTLPSGEALLAGYYLNELVLKLLARDDPHTPLFDHYAQAVAALARSQSLPHAGAVQAAVLRAFEVLLLRELGYLPLLHQDSATLQPLQPDTHYHLWPDSGLHPSPPPLTPHTPRTHTHGLRGQHWLALQHALDQPQPWTALCQVCSGACGQALRPLLRTLLHYHSGVRVFQTRQLLLDVQRLRAHPLAD